MNEEHIAVPTEGSENERLKKAILGIRDHIREIDAIFESVSDLLKEAEESSDAPATEEEIKDLLKKYSRL